MPKRFAKIEFMKDQEEVPVKFNILKKCPAFVMDWYIRKFNPFTIEDITHAGEKGYMIRLPYKFLLEPHPQARNIDELMVEMLYRLRDYSIDIIILPAQSPLPFPDVLTIATGTTIFPFFIMPAIKKALKYARKDIKHAELLIIDGNSKLTSLLIDNIYQNVNYLSVMKADITELTHFDYTEKAESIYDETGLNLRLSTKNKAALENADVIINTSSAEDRYDFHYQRSAIYFELGSNRKKTLELAGKREDMLIVDDLHVNVEQEYMSLKLVEAIFYIRYRKYRTLLYKDYNATHVSEIAEIINQQEIGVSTFWFEGKQLNSTYLSHKLSKAGMFK